jgi:hypothetical protein
MPSLIKNQYMDSITIQVINIEQYQEQFIHFYFMNSLLFLSVDIQSIEDMYKFDRIVSKKNTQETMTHSIILKIRHYILKTKVSKNNHGPYSKPNIKI